VGDESRMMSRGVRGREVLADRTEARGVDRSASGQVCRRFGRAQRLSLGLLLEWSVCCAEHGG
jgi:hypothetical protein